MMLALGAAVLGALAYGVGSVLQAYAARRAVGTAVIRHPAYLLGVGCDLVAFVGSVVAVRSLPLFAVQSVLAGSLGVTVVLGRVFLGTRVRRRDAAALLGIVGSLVVLALAAGVQSALPAPAWFPVVALLAALGAAALLVSLYGRVAPWRLAMLAGFSFAGSAIGARAVDLHAGWIGLPLQPIAWTIVAFGVIGSLAYARSLEQGSAGSSTAILWVVEVVVASLLGVGLLGDRVLPGWDLPALGAITVAILGCVVLAGAQPVSAQDESGSQTEGGRKVRRRTRPSHHLVRQRGGEHRGEDEVAGPAVGRGEVAPGTATLAGLHLERRLEHAGGDHVPGHVDHACVAPLIRGLRQTLGLVDVPGMTRRDERAQGEGTAGHENLRVVGPGAN